MAKYLILFALLGLAPIASAQVGSDVISTNMPSVVNTDVELRERSYYYWGFVLGFMMGGAAFAYKMVKKTSQHSYSDL